MCFLSLVVDLLLYVTDKLLLPKGLNGKTYLISLTLHNGACNNT